jgi:hypothetical protein
MSPDSGRVAEDLNPARRCFGFLSFWIFGFALLIFR